MYFTRERIDKCIDGVIKDFDTDNLKELFGADMSTDEIHKFVSEIVKSILVKTISVKMEKHICCGEGETFANGIKDFLNTFDCNFATKDILLKKMRRHCKNYVFYAEDRINDYSIFYFTFKLFDFYCQNCFTGNDISEEASRFAKIAYIYLKRPYKKTRITITCKLLFEYIEQFNISIPTKYIYTFIFISFVQALYNSEKLNEITRFSFFERFSKDIDMLNFLLEFSSLKTKKSSNMLELKNNKKLNKSISNRQQYLLSKGEKDEVDELKKVRLILKKIPQSNDEMMKKTEEDLQKIFGEVFELFDNEKFFENDVLRDLLHKYMQMTYDDNGKEVSLLNYTFEGIESSLSYIFHDLSSAISTDNIYVQLILSRVPSMQEYHTDNIGYQNFCNSIIQDIRAYVDQRISISNEKKDLHKYNKAIGKVHLKDFGMPILYYDISNNAIEDEVKFVSTATI